MAIIDYEETWDDSRIFETETRLIQGVFSARTTEAVEAAITFSKYLSTVGITPENYPVFLKILEIENHWVVDALIGNRDPFLLLSAVQPNEFIVSRIFAMMTKWHKGGIYHKNLSVILGVLQSVYSSPRDGYRIYSLRIADVNALGKHLDKDKGRVLRPPEDNGRRHSAGAARHHRRQERGAAEATGHHLRSLETVSAGEKSREAKSREAKSQGTQGGEEGQGRRSFQEEERQGQEIDAMGRPTSNSKKKTRRDREAAVIKVELTPAEVEIVVRACKTYKRTIPIYIESKREEVRVVDSVLNKLV
jgi:hypothetical protein